VNRYRKINLILQYEMGVAEPEKLSTEEYYKKYADYLYLKKKERDFWVGIFRQVISEAFGAE